jgi:hypothetical protein
MMTALLLTLTQKPIEIANDIGEGDKQEGRNFPPQVPFNKMPKRALNLTTWAGRIALVFTLAGAALWGVGTASWIFDPEGWLHVQTATLSFTLPVGVKQ